IEERHIDVLAFASRLSVAKRSLDGDNRIEAGKDIGDRDADLLRFAPRLAGNRHEAADALDDKIVARARCVGTILTEAGDRAVDEARVDGLQALIIETLFLQTAKLEVFEQDICVSDGLADRVGALGGRKADRK